MMFLLFQVRNCLVLHMQKAIEIKYYYIGVTQLRMRHKCNNPIVYIMYNVFT